MDESSAWAKKLDHIDLKQLSAHEARAIGELAIQNCVVVIPNQKLTVYEEADFCKKIGNIPRNSEREAGHSKDIILDHGVVRVTGQKNSRNMEGLFGHPHALDWHANKASHKLREPLVWLYAKEGTQGSRTSWINNHLAYQDLDDSLKAELESKKIYCGFEKGRYTDSPYFKNHINQENLFSLVYTNIRGQKGLYFPFLQIFGSVGFSERRWKQVYNYLIEHITQEKYIYHHDWQNGDVVISDQWLSIHKRWAFHKMQERVMHRIAFDYNQLISKSNE